MADEPAPVEQDKPTDAEAPDEGQAPTSESPETPENLEESYAELRKEFTQRSQDWATEREQAQQYQLIVEAASNPQHPQHEEALDALGLQTPDDEEPEYVDETEALQAKVEQMEAYLAERGEEEQFQAAVEAEDNFLIEAIGILQQQEGRSFTEKEARILADTARQNRNDQGVPDVAFAYEQLSEVYSSRQKDWLSSKKSPRAVGGGPAALPQFDINDASARLKASEAAAEAAGAE